MQHIYFDKAEIGFFVIFDIDITFSIKTTKSPFFRSETFFHCYFHLLIASALITGAAKGCHAGMLCFYELIKQCLLLKGFLFTHLQNTFWQI